MYILIIYLNFIFSEVILLHIFLKALKRVDYSVKYLFEKDLKFLRNPLLYFRFSVF